MNRVNPYTQRSNLLLSNLYTPKAQGANAIIASNTKKSSIEQMSKHRMLRQNPDGFEEKVSFSNQKANSMIFTNMQKYSDTIRASRQKVKDSSLQVKKLKYQFKDISSKILRSKTSASARQVVGQAKREVLRLKREKQNQNYDAEEIDAAINHAKAMERVARKKVRHLEEEELAKAAGGFCRDNGIEEEKGFTRECDEMQDQSYDGEEELASESGQYDSDYRTQMFAYADNNYDVTQIMDEGENVSNLTEDLLGEMTEEISKEMQNLLEEMGFEELMGERFDIGIEVNPEDLKRMQIKHRNKEMKEIVKADGDYLKVVFKQMEKMQSNAIDNSFSGSNYIGNSLDGFVENPITESTFNVVL